jgi:hypothetical protein
MIDFYRIEAIDDLLKLSEDEIVVGFELMLDQLVPFVDGKVFLNDPP